MCGLKSPNPQIRQTFFEIFNTNFNSNDLYDRLCYIIVTQNWEALGTHYWIKQCIQMTLGSCANANTSVQFSDISAQRFKFCNFSEAAANATDANENLFTPPMPPGNDSDAKNPVIMMNIDTNLNSESIWDAKGSSLIEPLADIMDKPEPTKFFDDLVSKKLINLFDSKCGE